MKPFDMAILCARAWMYGNEKIAKLADNDLQLAVALSVGEIPEREPVNPSVRVVFEASGGGDSGDIEDLYLEREIPEELQKENQWGQKITHETIKIPEFPLHTLYDEGITSDVQLDEYDWYNNEGGHVTVKIHPVTGEVEKFYSLYYTETNEEESSAQLDLSRVPTKWEDARIDEIKARQGKFVPGMQVTYMNNGTKEHGMIKSFVDWSNAWVVYDCGNDWSNFEQYTAERTPIDKMSPGWV